MPKVTDDYCLSLIFFDLEVTVNNRQLNQDLDKCFSNFKTKQKYTKKKSSFTYVLLQGIKHQRFPSGMLSQSDVKKGIYQHNFTG